MKKLIYACQIICMLACSVFTSGIGQNIIFPADFNAAMVSHEKDKDQYNEFFKQTPHKELLALIMQQYYLFSNKQGAEQQHIQAHSIPKIIHQIWIGPYPFPQEAKKWQESWIKMHPDWEYKLWTNQDVDQFDFENKIYFDQARNWGEKADILRYEILYRFGGLYADADFACLKSFDWLHERCDFYTGIHAVPLLFEHKLRINNGLIGARPGHPILERAISQIPFYRHEKGVAQRTGPDFFTQTIQDVLPSTIASGSLDLVFPSNFFYPSGEKGGPGYKLKDGEAYVQPETMAVHYYTAYWIVKPKPKQAVEKELAIAHNVSSLSVDSTQVIKQDAPDAKKEKTCQLWVPLCDPYRKERRYQQYIEKRKI
ncbi:MAG: glycosyltransferase family 32 protein [Candidatus Babeliales bacterium]